MPCTKAEIAVTECTESHALNILPLHAFIAGSIVCVYWGGGGWYTLFLGCTYRVRERRRSRCGIDYGVNHVQYLNVYSLCMSKNIHMLLSMQGAMKNKKIQRSMNSKNYNIQMYEWSSTTIFV